MTARRRRVRAPVHATEVAKAFDEIADLLELTGANTFRVRAYQNAAQSIRDWPQDLSDWAAEGHSFDEIPGIGKDLAGKIQEILDSGSCALLRQLRQEQIAALAPLLHVGGLGAKRLQALSSVLGVYSPKQLLRAARQNQIRGLRGFGATSEEHIADTIETWMRQQSRKLWAQVRVDAEGLSDYLRASPAALNVVAAGSYRRMQETVGDLDIVAASADAAALMRHFLAYGAIRRVIARGPTRSSVELSDGLQVDLRVVAADELGAALVYFTGSRAHTIELRGMARKIGLKINEYGVYDGEKRIAGDSEASVYATLGLPEIPPELRENRGEIEAAQHGELPRLVEYGDLRGDLHVHAGASDGHSGLAAMAEAARAAGLAYIAITDDSRTLHGAGGLDAAQLARQADAIDRLNEKLRGIRLLKGIEVEILEDGALDLPDSVLARMDVVVAAVHSGFHLPRSRQTDRLLRAIDHKHFSILAHPTGRLIGERAPMDLDMARVLRHAHQRGCFLELNADPKRVDLNDVLCRMAKAEGVRIAVSSDAHSPSAYSALRFGIGQARRAWLERADVLNTRSLGELRKLLAATMG